MDKKNHSGKIENIKVQKSSDRKAIPQRKQMAMGSKSQASNLGKCYSKKCDK